MKKILFCLGLLCLNTFGFANPPYPIHILAAENFYGDIAKSIGGIYVSVNSVMTSPNNDPHFFNAPSNLETLVNNADIIIENGAGYDKWMDVLYQKSGEKAVLMDVNSIAHTGTVFNPHIWYNPATMPAFATALAAQLSQMDPANQGTYKQNLTSFLNMAQLYQAQLQKVRAQVKGTPVTATEPIADALATALDLEIKNKQFQTEVMNNVNPLSPSLIQKFQDSLIHHEVRLLLFNHQVTNPTAEQMKHIANQNQIPVLGVDELMPANLHYYAWMYEALFGIQAALVANASS